MGLGLHSEFRDGNVPAGYELLRVPGRPWMRCRPEWRRCSIAGTQPLTSPDASGRYCAEGENQRFWKIEFAVGVDATPAFKSRQVGMAEVPGTLWVGPAALGARGEGEEGAHGARVG